jgi:hypothetical protein
VAGAENAVAPIASTPKAAAAKRVFSFNELNIGRPLFYAQSHRYSARRWEKDVQVKRFRTFARNRQNGFVPLGNCFIKVSLTAGLDRFPLP